MTGAATRGSVVAGTVLVLALIWSALAVAIAPAQHGWWYRLNQRAFTGLPVPEPANVPEEGLYVARDLDPEEPLAIAALSFDTPDSTAAVLELKIAEDYRSQAEVAQIAACPTTGSFATEFAALWENRPTPQCETGKVLDELLGDDVMTWTLPEDFEVFPGFWSFVLVPDCVGEGVTGTDSGFEDVGCEAESPEEENSPFQVAFEKPDGAAFTVTPEEETAPPPPANVGSIQPAPGNGGGGGFDFGGDRGSGAAPSFGGTTGDGPGTPGPGGLADEATGTSAEPGRTDTAGPVGDTDDTLARTVAIVMLAILGGGLWMASGFTARRPQLAGGGAGGGEGTPEGEGRFGGLGRFIRRRTSGARKLR